jgi:hypothetical protein
VPIGLGVQLLRLCVQGLQAVLHALAPPLVLRQGDDAEQVGLGEPLELLVEPALGFVQLLAPGLQLLRQPSPALGAGKGLGNLLGGAEQRAEVLPDQFIQLVRRGIPRCAGRFVPADDRIAFGPADVILVPGPERAAEAAGAA